MENSQEERKEACPDCKYTWSSLKYIGRITALSDIARGEEEIGLYQCPECYMCIIK